MDRITQLQNEIEVVGVVEFDSTRSQPLLIDTLKQLLTIMSASISYLCSKTNFKQVNNTIPITKQRNPEKFDPPEVFEGDNVVFTLLLYIY